MNRLGVVARADSGGLGNLTWELCRHLEPFKVLIMDLGEYGRSDIHVDRYEGLDYRVSHGLAPTRDDRAWLLDGCSVVYSAETWYADEFPHEARRAGVRTVLHVMPELHVSSRVADEIWTPTTYRREHLPPHSLVPVPVALDRFTHRVRSPANHFVHLWAPAMLDRNGTNATLAALEMVKSPIRATIVGAQGHLHLERPSPVTFDCTPRGYPRDYFDVLPPDADVLVLPRRYAGLSMPVQEAAAQGIPTVMTDVSPQSRWPGVFRVPVRGKQGVVMAGGKVDVFDPDPAGIAWAIDEIASDPSLATQLSEQAYGWAQQLSWDVWKPRYQARLLGDG